MSLISATNNHYIAISHFQSQNPIDSVGSDIIGEILTYADVEELAVLLTVSRKIRQITIKILPKIFAYSPRNDDWPFGKKLTVKNLVHLAGLAGKNLKVLKLVKGFRRRDLYPIIWKCPEIQEIFMSNAEYNLWDLIPLKNLINLVVDRLESRSKYADPNTFLDLSPLPYFKKLTYFSANYWFFEDLGPLGECASLEDLELGFDEDLTENERKKIQECKNIEAIFKLKNLKILGISYFPILDSIDFNRIAPLPKIEDLGLDGTGIKDLSFLSHFPHIRALSACDNEISDLTPLGSCKKLQQLELSSNRFLSDLTPLENCSELENIELSNTSVSKSNIMSLIKCPKLQRIQSDLDPDEEADFWEAFERQRERELSNDRDIEELRLDTENEP